MKTKVILFFVLLAVSAILVSCDPSQDALNEQATQTADTLAATRTQVYLEYQASKPTATLTATIMPTPTNTLTPTLPATLPYHYFRMSSTLIGWAWGSIDGTDHLWRTNDGGLTWVDISPQIEKLDLRAKFFLDLMNAWVVVCGLPDERCGLVRTSDGGETWTVVNDSGIRFWEYSLKFFNEREGIMFSYSVGAGGGLYRFLETQNGGTTWTAVIFYSGHLGDNSLGDRMGEYKICNICGDALYLDRSRLIIVFGQGDMEPQDEIELLVSTNRGQSFKEIKLSLPPGRFNQSLISPHEPVFFDDNVGILSVYLKTEDESHAAVAFYATTDGGLNWTFRSFVEMEVGGANRFRSRLDFVSPQDIFARCGDNLCVTHDGAQTWQTISSNLNFGGEGDYPVGLLDFVDATTGWASVQGEKTIWRTTDGGQTWQELSSVIVEKDLSSPTPSSSTPAATPTPTDTTLEITSIHVNNETDGWGIGESSVWITRDGGRNWRDVTPREIAVLWIPGKGIG